MELCLAKTGNKEFGESITDIYLTIMLFLFPLFPGFSGYQNITEAKYFFLIITTAAWSVSLIIFCAVRRPSLSSRFSAAHCFAAVFLFVLSLSWWLSPYRSVSFLGSGRFDGLFSDIIYLLIFFGVSLFSRPKLIHLQFFSLSISLCLILSLVQLCGLNPLRLFPGGLTFYDSGLSYSGVFLGTIGNMNIYDAIICLSIPSFLCIYITESRVTFLIPVLLSTPVLLKAGGDGLKVSLILFLLCLFPIVLTSVPRIKRFLRASSYFLFVFGISIIWQPSVSSPFVFHYSVTFVVVLLASLLLYCISRFSWLDHISLTEKQLQRFFIIICLFLILFLFLFLLFSRTGTGTISEIRNMLNGHWEDDYGSSRIRIWRECLSAVKEYPILGSGPGTVALRLDITFSRFVPETGRTLQSFVDNAHNVYLGYLVNCGILGLASYCILLFSVFFQFFRKRKNALLLSSFFAVLTCAAHEFFGLGLCLSEPLFWLMLGILCVKEPLNTEADNCEQ